MAATDKTGKKLALQDLKGKRLAFFGEFSYWPSYHYLHPPELAEEHGALVCKEVSKSLDYLVLGDRRGSGKSKAKKDVEKFIKDFEERKSKGAAATHCPTILDEAAFREICRKDISGKSFAFIGGFDCCGGDVDDALLERMVQGAGAVVSKNIDENLDYVVVGARRGTGKIAAHNRAQKLQAEGAKLKIIDEDRFLELVRTDAPASSLDGGTTDFATFISRLYGTVDQGKFRRAMKMLKSESFKLYSHHNEERLVGVVRSQRDPDKVYSSWLTFEGKYGCSSQDLSDCMGLQGSTCKHLLVLLVGLTHAGELQADIALNWIRAAQRKSPRTDTDFAAATFIEYRGAQVGEIDWRPTETIPEDYYAF